MEHVCEGPSADPAQVRFELGERHLNGVQIGTVRWQEQESASGLAQGFGSVGNRVRGQIIEDDNGTGFQFWYQHLLNVCRKSCAIHRALDNPRCDQRVSAETCDEG